MSLDLDKLGALLDLLALKDIAEFEHEENGVRVRVARGARGAPASAAAVVAQVAGPAIAPAPDSTAHGHVDVTSPFVGSFYSAPSPDAPPFVEVGSVVRSGQTLCIIEAMKLMNEIEAECSGTVVEVFAQNGKNVEFGQKLFRIKKA